MENKENLKTALQQFDIFYKNIGQLVQDNKKSSKKLIGHSIYRKSDNVLFNLIESVGIVIGSVICCGILKYYNLLPYDMFITASVVGIASESLALATNHSIYHINNKVGGPIGRTYAKMQTDDFISVLQEIIKKEYKALLNNKATDEQKIEAFNKFAETLNNVSNNLQIDLEKLHNRVKKYSTKRQQKWQPILDYAQCYCEYLSNNAAKFNIYAKKLNQDDNAILVDSKEKLNDIMLSYDKKYSSEYNKFIKYLEMKKKMKECLGYNIEQVLEDEEDAIVL